MKRLQRLGFAAFAATVAGSAPAAAQCRLCATPTTARAEAAEGGDVALEVETSLNFDRLIVSGQGSGAAILRPDGSTSAVGAVSQVSPRAMVGSVAVRGEPNRQVRIELPRRIDLYSVSGGRISFDDVVSDAAALPRLDSAGRLTFRFGGRLTVSGDAEGDYRGELPIVVEYP
jgi:hypothetical protein